MMQNLSKIKSLEKLFILDKEGSIPSGGAEGLLALPNLKELTIPEHWELRNELILDFRAKNIRLFRSSAVAPFL
jgi:hypothetical protein